jgi:hypothetical protein
MAASLRIDGIRLAYRFTKTLQATFFSTLLIDSRRCFEGVGSVRALVVGDNVDSAESLALALQFGIRSPSTGGYGTLFRSNKQPQTQEGSEWNAG